jgi:ferredoxin--NADP+ reductase
MGRYKVISRRNLGNSAYVLCFERKDIFFVPGQHIYVGLDEDDNRPYSIYSGILDDFIEILVKEVDNGIISHKLKLIQAGEYVSIEKPQGSFTIEDKEIHTSVWLIGTGTGISPFHSFVRSYPVLNYKIIHGIRYFHEAYDRDAYDENRYMSCTSRETKGDFNGRVTEYLNKENINKQASYFLCGNYNMIDEVFDMLTSFGIDKMKIKTEGYF